MGLIYKVIPVLLAALDKPWSNSLSEQPKLSTWIWVAFRLVIALRRLVLPLVEFKFACKSMQLFQRLSQSSAILCARSSFWNFHWLARLFGQGVWLWLAMSILRPQYFFKSTLPRQWASVKVVTPLLFAPRASPVPWCCVECLQPLPDFCLSSLYHSPEICQKSNIEVLHTFTICVLEKSQWQTNRCTDVPEVL